MASNSKVSPRNADSLFDVAIVGGAVAGAALARGLQRSQLRIALLSRDAPPEPETAGFEARVYAISPANAGFLRELDAWQFLPAERLTPVRAMRVFGDAPAAEINFDAYRG